MAEPVLVSTVPVLSKALRRAREARGWTQADVAQALGVRDTTLASWERGADRPAVAMWIAWARVVGMPLWAMPEPVVEHAIEMSGGGMHIRNDDPEIDRIFPLADWVKSHQRFGGHVWRRTVIVVEDWEEVPR